MPQAKASTKPAAATLPPGIEVFAAGTRTADDGSVHTITAADLAASAAAYDPAVHEAPHTIGHPKDNAPAYGWIERFTVQDGVLQIAASKQVEPQFAELVADGRIKKRSMSFYHPRDASNPKPGIWYPRHVAWLGAQPPAVKGLKDVNFSEDDAAGAVNFSEPTTTDPATSQESDDMSKELQAQLDEANTKLAAEKTAREKAEADAATHKKAAEQAQETATSFAEQARKDRKATFVSFAEAQVKAGRLLPKDKDMAVATLDVLADAKPVQFAEGDATRQVSPAQWLQDLIATAKPVVSFGEFAGGGAAQQQAGSAKGKSDAEIDQAAQAYARQNKVNYAEALTAVTASFTA